MKGSRFGAADGSAGVGLTAGEANSDGEGVGELNGGFDVDRFDAALQANRLLSSRAANNGDKRNFMGKYGLCRYFLDESKICGLFLVKGK
ncbi:MAG: hypothetical protein Kow00121_62610 [Elainellaceae cyanobacterium]